MEPKELHAVVYKDAESDQWLAQCLELDVVTQGDNEQHALAMIKEAVELHLEDMSEADLDALFQPIAGEPATLQVELSGLARDAAFELVTEDGKVIQPIHLRPETSGDDSEYYGSFELPARPFRVAVTGRDDKGNDYQRYFHL